MHPGLFLKGKCAQMVIVHKSKFKPETVEKNSLSTIGASAGIEPMPLRFSDH